MHPRAHIRQLDVIRFGRDVGAGPTIEEFRGAVREVDTAVTARVAKVIMPVGSVEGDACAGEETAPRDSGQDVEVFFGIAFVRHVDGRAFVIGLEFSGGSFTASRAAGTTRPQDETFIFEGHDGLRLQVHVDGFQGVGNVRRKRRQLHVWHEADVFRSQVEVLVQVIVHDLVPDASVRRIRFDGCYPVRRAVVDAVGAVRINVVGAARIRKRDGDLAEGLLALQFCDDGLQTRLNGDDLSRVDVALREPVPDAVVGAFARQLGLDLQHLILADQFDLLGLEGWRFVERHAADGGASLKTDGGFEREHIAEAQFGQREGQKSCGTQFEEFASGDGHGEYFIAFGE